MYTALVLTQASQTRLLAVFRDIIPVDWTIYCHHMTINMGNVASGPLVNSNFQLGENATVTAIGYACDQKVMAVSVESNIPSVNKQKHITIAVNHKEGGKPFYSNKLTNWESITPLILHGTIEEVQ